MGDLNQLEFARQHRDMLRGPVLEIGSKDYGSTPDLRALFGATDYVGIDLEEGPGVDRVLDLTAGFEDVDAVLEGRRFGTVLCLSVLEHCRDPFALSANVARLLRPDGVLYVSVPFAWEFHGYPSDYWRFTPEGVKTLFPRLDFRADDCRLHTPRRGDLRPLDRDLGAVVFSTRRAIEGGRYGRVASIAVMRAARALGMARWLFGYSKVFPPTMIDMLGRPRA